MEEDDELPFNPDWVTIPGSHLREYLDVLHISDASFLTRTGFTPVFLADLLKGDALITDEVAEKIAGVIGNSQQFWLNLERIYREGLEKGLQVV